MLKNKKCKYIYYHRLNLKLCQLINITTLNKV